MADQTTAQERTAALVAQGWRPWPPWPAPELASALADAHPGLKECPYLLAASDEPKDLLVRPDRTVTCFESVAQMEEALEREAVIRFHQGQAVPCVELRSIKIKDLKQARVRALMHRCRAMGIVVEARGTKIERGREVRRRTKRNRAPTKPIKPATR